MISKVSLKNFKLHASTNIEAASITVFIGPNNSGKSSIFQALLSLRQAATNGWLNLYDPNRRNNPEAQILDIGEFDDVVRHGEKEMQIGVFGEISSPRPAAYKKLLIGFDVHIRGNTLAFHNGTFQGFTNISKELMRPHFNSNWEWLLSSNTNPSFSIQEDNATLKFRGVSDFRLIDTFGIDSPPGTSQMRSIDLSELQKYYATAPTQMLESLHPVFPLRGFEEWSYTLPDYPAKSLARLSLPDRAVALASRLVYDRGLERRLSEWLSNLIGIVVEFKLVPPKRVTIRCKPASAFEKDGLLLNEGSGANQLPFILIPVGLANEDETILLSEPEAHLHPALQSKLMQHLLKDARQRKLQYFIETHSEHVLHSLLHTVARGDLKKDELAIYYFENVEGEAKVRRLPVNEMGQVEGGLPGFFDQALTELTEYLDVMAKKK